MGFIREAVDMCYTLSPILVTVLGFALMATSAVRCKGGVCTAFPSWIGNHPVPFKMKDTTVLGIPGASVPS